MTEAEREPSARLGFAERLEGTRPCRRLLKDGRGAYRLAVYNVFEAGSGTMSGRVLFLCCCSNRKLAGGDNTYRNEDALPRALGRRGRELVAARQQVLNRIRTGARSVQGAVLSDLPYNSRLVEGRDFGGNAATLYMPAVLRYRGRFFQELDPEETGVPGNVSHCWLFVSALYGLVAPNEPIQWYSCHTLDDIEIARTWSDGLLTSLLLHYVKAFDVRLVIDLIADESYRELFNWERVPDPLAYCGRTASRTPGRGSSQRWDSSRGGRSPPQPGKSCSVSRGFGRSSPTTRM